MESISAAREFVVNALVGQHDAQNFAGFLVMRHAQEVMLFGCHRQQTSPANWVK